MSHASVQDTDAIENRVPWAFALPIILLGLLPLAYAAILTWQEYLRLGVIAAGLGAYVWYWPEGGRQVQALLALGLMFVVTQFDPATSARAEVVPVVQGNAAFVISALLAGGAFVVFLLSRKPWVPFRIIDGVVVGAMLLGLGFFAGSHLFYQNPLPWHSMVKVVAYGMVWFAVTRGLSGGMGKPLLSGLAVVFAVVCVVGVVRMGMAMYHHRAAQGTEDLEVAVAHFERAAEGARLLRLDVLRDAAVFGKAERLYRAGDVAGASRALSMEDGFVVSVASDAWEGPAGGMLYTNISCWKDLILYEGRAEVRIFARGQQALGVWPLMRVRLGNQTLGVVSVDSPEARPYVFEVPVGRGRPRLEVSFTNDYFNPPEDRNLWVEQAEVRYLEMAWK